MTYEGKMARRKMIVARMMGKRKGKGMWRDSVMRCATHAGGELGGIGGNWGEMHGYR